MTDLPTYDDGRLVLRYAENTAFRCPACDDVVAVELGDPNSSVHLRCVACDEPMALLDVSETADWMDVNPDAYANWSEDSDE